MRHLFERDMPKITSSIGLGCVECPVWLWIITVVTNLCHISSRNQTVSTNLTIIAMMSWFTSTVESFAMAPVRRFPGTSLLRTISWLWRSTIVLTHWVSTFQTFYITNGCYWSYWMTLSVHDALVSNGQLYLINCWRCERHIDYEEFVMLDEIQHCWSENSAFNRTSGYQIV